MTRSQSRLAAAAKPKPKAQPKPNPKAEFKPKPQPKKHAFFAPQARDRSKGANHNPSPTLGPPSICVGCSQPLQPSMATCCSKIWTYETCTSPASSGKYCFC